MIKYLFIMFAFAVDIITNKSFAATKPTELTDSIIASGEDIQPDIPQCKVLSAALIRIASGENIQPNIPQCIELSAAPISNEEVTQCYIDQFFRIPTNPKIIELRKTVGLDTSKPIISTAGGFDQLPDHIKNAFTMIAEDKVGRMLLFRLLLEIHKRERTTAIQQRQITFANDASGMCYSSCE
jgi:hypothetical protein